MRALLLAGAAAIWLLPATGRAQVMANHLLHYDYSDITRIIQCTGTPIALDGSRTNLTLVGGCTRITVTGNNNEISVDIVPHGVIEVTGAHNEVSWRQLVPGPEPTLLSRGADNHFYRGVRGR
ncbi:MAG: DUF3060 domain-containing protein [Acidisphaera sp.]|nr:DUF3060 domain-containing protein [Acidisphaera sp.]